MMLRKVLATLGSGLARKLRSRQVQALLDRGESFVRSGNMERAARCYKEALALDGSATLAHGRLALLLTGAGRLEEALTHYRAAYMNPSLRGDLIESYVRILLQNDERDEAWRVARDAAQKNPLSYESWLSLGLTALASHADDEALASFDRALEVRGDAPDAHTNRGIALQNLGRVAEAHEAYAEALRLQPGHMLAHFHRALALLGSRDYAAGWSEYEARLASAELPRRPHAFERWHGANPAGHTLLVYGEQGLGDEIMFASCLPDLLRAEARCIVECNPKLRALFERSFPRAIVYAAAADKRVPEHILSLGIDCQVPLGSLPLYYRRSDSDFPPHRGYLTADASRIAFWRARLAALGSGLKVGISWQGGTHATRAALRSVQLEAWLQILRMPQLELVSLQYTPDAPQHVQAMNERYGLRIQHWPEAIADYDETAALVSALDLTVTVCTSVADLAGALGRPVWIMAPANPDWRFGYTGETMPWYPSARLFRQARGSDWSDVITSIERHLRQRVVAA